jgi:DNA-binding NarL/FixJ family response regulator
MRDGDLSCVLLADRHHELTEDVRGLLETTSAAVIMVADETSLLEGASRLQPDVIVVDLSLAQHSSLNWLRTARESFPGKLVVSSVHDEKSARRAAMTAGADAFVLKRAIATDLMSAIDLAREGRPDDASTGETGCTTV